MSELDRAIGLEEANIPPRSPRFVLSRHRAALLIVLAYFAAVAFVAGLLVAVEQVQNLDDDRNIDAIIIFASALLLPLALALFNIYRRSPRPSWPS